MNLRQILMGLAIAVALILAGMAAGADPPPWMLHHHGMFPMMGMSGLSGDQQQLYVLAGGKIMRYSLPDLKLLKTVYLPKPEPPASLKSKGNEECQFPPPPPFPMAGPHGLWAGNGALYVLAGPRLYRYSTPDLTLKSQTELPKPELPKANH
jgi:hypothetical protein